MSEAVEVRGMVLSAIPYRDYDKRITLLTKERGKITVFANGARKPKSRLQAVCTPFCFGSFSVYEGKTAYTLDQAEISNYFDDLKQDLEASCYGMYFLEIADYYAHENLDGSDLLNLLYASLRALLFQKISRQLIRAIFELKAMALDGVYPYDMTLDPHLQEGTRYAISFVLQNPISHLFTFTLTPELEEEFCHLQERLLSRQTSHEFKSLDIIRTLLK